MTEILKNDLFEMLEKDCNNCYIGLAKITDVSKIFQFGLWNEKGDSIGDVLSCFELSIDNKKLIEEYGSKGDIIVVCAIPITFDDSKGRKLFGGIRGHKKKYLDEKVDCLSDYLFKNTIPKEMIYGYYEVSDDKLLFTYNNGYYSKLIPVNKDAFIDKYFEVLGVSIDINDELLLDLDDSSIPFKYIDGLKSDIKEYLDKIK